MLLLRRSRPAGCFLALFLFIAAPATSFGAAGVSIAWDHCLGEGTGVQNKSFACNTNAGSWKMVGSFTLGSDMPIVVGEEMVIDVATASATLPDWWRFRAHTGVSQCRSTSLSATFLPDPADAVCIDWSSGQMQGGLITCPPDGPCASSSPNVNRLKVIAAVVQQAAADLVGGVEYFAFSLIIDNAKTVGAGSCAGCEVPACLVFNSIALEDRGGIHRRTVSTSAVPGGNFLTWQGGGVPSTPQGTGCPAATPTRQSTWGSLKALYR